MSTSSQSDKNSLRKRGEALIDRLLGMPDLFDNAELQVMEDLMQAALPATPSASASPGATPGAYRWIEEATRILKSVAPVRGHHTGIDDLLSGVPCPPQDLGFNSPADRYARAWHALNASRSHVAKPLIADMPSGPVEVRPVIDNGDGSYSARPSGGKPKGHAVTQQMYEAGLRYLNGRGTAWCCTDLYLAMEAERVKGEAE
jgi:hypothetical protein